MTTVEKEKYLLKWKKLIFRIIICSKLMQMANGKKKEDTKNNIDESDNLQNNPTCVESRSIEAYQEAADFRKTLNQDFNNFCDSEIRNFRKLCLDAKIFFYSIN